MTTETDPTTPTQEIVPAEHNSHNYLRLKSELRKVYADNIGTGEPDENAYVIRNLNFLATTALRLSTLKQLLKEIKFGQYNNFHPIRSLDAIIKRYGADTLCYFGRAYSPVLFLIEVPQGEQVKRTIGSCDEIGRQQDGTVRLWWD